MSFFDENNSSSVGQEVKAALVDLGQLGSITTNKAIIGNFAAVQCITNCQFEKISAINSDYTFFYGINIPAGTIFRGPFTEINPLSGVFTAYKSSSGSEFLTDLLTYFGDTLEYFGQQLAYTP